MRLLRVSLVVCVLLWAIPAIAQDNPRPPSAFELGIYGGAAFPFGDLSDEAETGIQGGVSITHLTPDAWAGFRVELSRVNFGEMPIGGGRSTDPSITSLTGGLYLRPRKILIPDLGTPWAYVGIGGMRWSLLPEISDTDFGFTAGGGFRFRVNARPGFTVGISYNRINASGGALTYIPVTAGITW